MKTTASKAYTYTNLRTHARLGTYTAADHLAAGAMMARAQGYKTFEDWMGATGDALHLFMVTT